jgi:hypothetical protein
MANKDTKPAPKPLATSIHLAIAAISLDIMAIPKDQKNEAQGFKFRGIDDFYNALHEIFARHGVVMLPSVEQADYSSFQNTKGNTCFVARVRMRYTFSATDGSKLECMTAGEGYDFGDKAVNKAMSAAHKYALAQTFLIPTVDMPDADKDTIEPTVNPRGNPYEGKNLKVLTAMRDEIMAANDKPPQELLGRIAELRVEEEEKAATTTAAAPTKAAAPAAVADPAPPAATPAAPKAPAALKTTRKPAAPPAAATPPPAADQAPGAIDEPPPEPDEDFGDAGEASAGGDPTPEQVDAAMEYVISDKCIKHPAFVGKKLGQLSQENIASMHEKWVLKFAKEIEASEAKKALRDQILIVKWAWDNTPQPPSV